jgi:hypothetical protein
LATGKFSCGCAHSTRQIIKTDIRKEDLSTMMMSTARARRLLLTVLLVALVAYAAQPMSLYAQSESARDAPEAPAQIDPPTRGMSGDEIFTELLQHNDMRNAELKRYSAIRTYAVTNASGKLYARQIVQLAYRAPDTKMFTTTFEEGSGLVRHMVFKRLIDSETDTAVGKEHHDSSITPANYSFELVGEERVGPYYCFVIRATPKRQDKYLFEGTIWIDVCDFAIVKIAGHPAKRPSFWIERADFVRQYQRIGQFWLPLKDQTVVHVKLNGIKILTIDHGEYALNDSTTDRQEMQSSNESPERFSAATPTNVENPCRVRTVSISGDAVGAETAMAGEHKH